MEHRRHITVDIFFWGGAWIVYHGYDCQMLQPHALISGYEPKQEPDVLIWFNV